jgi:thioredoxin 1
MLSSDEYRLLIFSGSWCVPCGKMHENISEAIKDITNVKIVEVDVDKEPDMTREYKVRSIPFLVLLKGDDAIGTMVGVRPVEEIKKFLAQA